MAPKSRDIKLQEETIRNMQRRKAPKKPRLKNPAGGVKRTPFAKTPQLTSQTKRPMNPLVIQDRRNKLKKPRLSDQTIAPMSTKAIKNRKTQLKKPKLKNPAKGVRGGASKPNPQLKSKTKRPMNPLVINDRKNKIKKPKLNNPAKGAKRKELKKPQLINPAKGAKGKKVKKPQLINPAKGAKGKKVKKPQLINPAKGVKGKKVKKPQLINPAKGVKGKKVKKPQLINPAKGVKGKKVKKPKLKSPAKGVRGGPPKPKPQLSSKTKRSMNPLVIRDRKNKIKKPIYPVAGFLFKVEVGEYADETSFKEVSGLNMEREVELIVEGGNNDFVHKVPKGATKYSNLVLKRGLISLNSKLGKWCLKDIQSMLSEQITPKEIRVKLLDMHSRTEAPLMTWSFANAWPVKWEVSGFDAQKSEVVIESIEFAYQNFSVS